MDDLLGNVHFLQHILQYNGEWPPAVSLSCGSMEKVEEERLLRYLQSGTRQQREQSFTVLYQRYYQDVWKFICSKVKDEEDARDIFATVWVIGVERLPNFEWKGKPIKSWLFTTADNAIKEYFRTKKNQPLCLDDNELEEKIWKTIEATLELRPPTSLDETSPQIEQEADKRVQELLAQLKDRERKILTYKYFQNRTNIEIAKLLGESPSNVGAILSRTMQKLRKISGAK